MTNDHYFRSYMVRGCRKSSVKRFLTDFCIVIMNTWNNYEGGRQMNDEQIVELYWTRVERAIEETARKYGHFCFSIANGILRNKEDSDESVNDTYWQVWNAVPPQRPQSLKAFLGKITRNLALHKWEKRQAKKRGKDEVTCALEELQECISGKTDVEQITEQMVLVDTLNRFLAGIDKENRVIFMQRYFCFLSIKEIAVRYRIGESKVKMSLLRSRAKLKELLEKEEIVL